MAEKLNSHGRPLPCISIIVPIFNAENYLKQCIQSILEQSFRDFELMLIDDGSTDNSGAIIDSYSFKDARIHVFHQANGGVSSARNAGLKHARGKWIVFVDADDYVLPDYLRHLYAGFAGGNDDRLLVWGSVVISGTIRKQFPKEVMKGGKAAQYVMNNGILALSAPYSKSFSRQVILNNGIEFPVNVKMGEDGIFLQRYLNAIETVSFISDVDYYVHDTPGSLSKHINSFDSEWECFVTWKHLIAEYVYKYKTQFTAHDETIWNNRVGKSFIRCLFSVSQQQPQWSIIRQWNTLKEVPAQEYKEFKRYYRPKSFSEKVYKCLIDYHRLFLFVLIINRRHLFRLCQK